MEQSSTLLTKFYATEDSEYKFKYQLESEELARTVTRQQVQGLGSTSTTNRARQKMIKTCEDVCRIVLKW